MRGLCLVIVMAALAGALSAHASRADEPAGPGLIEVGLRTGRILTGEVDPATDERVLRLRLGSPRIAITSTVGWEQVEWIGTTGEGKAWSAEEVRGWARAARGVIPAAAIETPPLPGPNEPLVIGPSPALPGPMNAGFANLEPTAPALTPAPPPVPPLPPQALFSVEVQSLAVDVKAANWDADAEDDGIEVRIFPRASDNRLVPVDGSVRVRLIGRRLTTNRTRDQRIETTLHPELGVWSLPVRPWHYRDGGAVLRFPWQRIDPTRDPSIDTDARVLVEVGATGGRTVKATAPVQLRSRWSTLP